MHVGTGFWTTMSFPENVFLFCVALYFTWKAFSRVHRYIVLRLKYNFSHKDAS